VISPLWCLIVLVLGNVVLTFRVQRANKRIARLELDRQGIFRVLGNLVADHPHYAAIELCELQRASQGFCTSHRNDGAPCTLRLGHDGMHSYAGALFKEPMGPSQ